MKGKYLITGGTGSFGSAMVEHLLSLGIDEVRILSRDEKKQDDMRKRFRESRVKFFIGDVRDQVSIEPAVEAVDYVFHAAALKQVPSCEFFPLEAMKTNVIGTSNVISASRRAGVKKIVVLSTDKAVYPINAMGLSKGLMEKVALAEARVTKGPVICVTRYGNVMGSRGSVIPLFLRQILAGESITITNPEMTRFMMSMDEAIALVQFAFDFGEPGDLFVKKSPSMKVGTLATSLKNIFQCQELEVKRLGTRHGEKIHETLLSKEERSEAIELDDYFLVKSDVRDLNYDNYELSGGQSPESRESFNSGNAERLEGQKAIALLKSLPEIRNALEQR